MAWRRHKAVSHEQRDWLGLIKFLWIMLLLAAFFFLAQSMVHHHFFSGGALNNRMVRVVP